MDIEQKVITVTVPSVKVVTLPAGEVWFRNNYYHVLRALDDDSYTRYLQLKDRTDALYNEKERIETKVDDNYAAHETQLQLLSTNLGSEAYLSSVLSATFNSTKQDAYNYADARVASEAQLRVNDKGVLISMIDDVRGDFETADSTLQANITEEKNIRISEDQALASRMDSMESSFDSDIGSVNARITTEETTRASQDSALSQRIDTLSATVDTNHSQAMASINSEETTRATEDSALASRIDTLTATVSDNKIDIEAKLTHEENVRISDDQALSERIDTLSASVNTETADLQAQITEEATTRANEDEAIGQRIDTIETDYKSADSTLQANITSEQTARVDADNALTTRIDTIEADYKDADQTLQANITSEETARVNQDQALSQRIDTVESDYKSADTQLSSRIDTNEQSITSNTNDISTINNSSIPALQTDIDDFKTGVKNGDSGYVWADASKIAYVDYNGKKVATGFQMLAGASAGQTISAFAIYATDFYIQDSNTKYIPFSISGGNINFNGKVTFSNVTDTESLIKENDDIDRLNNNVGYMNQTGVDERVTTLRPDSEYKNTNTSWTDVQGKPDFGNMAFEDVVEYAKLGETVVDGAYIKTTLLDTEAIRATFVGANRIVAENIDATNLHVSSANIDGTITADSIVANATIEGTTIIGGQYLIETSVSGKYAKPIINLYQEGSSGSLGGAIPKNYNLTISGSDVDSGDLSLFDDSQNNRWEIVHNSSSSTSAKIDQLEGQMKVIIPFKFVSYDRRHQPFIRIADIATEFKILGNSNGDLIVSGIDSKNLGANLEGKLYLFSDRIIIEERLGSVIYEKHWLRGTTAVYCGYEYNSAASLDNGNLFIKYHTHSTNDSTTNNVVKTIPIASVDSTTNTTNRCKNTDFHFIEVNGSLVRFLGTDTGISIFMRIKCGNHTSIFQNANTGNGIYHFDNFVDGSGNILVNGFDILVREFYTGNKSFNSQVDVEIVDGMEVNGSLTFDQIFIDMYVYYEADVSSATIYKEKNKYRVKMFNEF